jgi:hypothetical protein
MYKQYKNYIKKYFSLKTSRSGNVKGNFDFGAENVLRFQLFLKSLFLKNQTRPQKPDTHCKNQQGCLH